MKVLISKKTGNFYYYKEKGDFHSKEGFITEKELKSGETVLFTNTKREFLVFNSNFYDEFKVLKRGPQLITQKDLGYIIARGGVNKTSKIIEAGSGSGAATCFFAGIADKVKSFDIIEKHLDIAKKNTDRLGFENAQYILGDLKDFIEKEEKNSCDMLFLDMPEPNAVLEKDLSCVKSGSYIVCYLPSIFQIQLLTKLISQRVDLYLEEISEVILREWRVWEKVARPNHRKDIDHTAFLIFIRKV